jgi:hypothetical protein
MNNSTHFFLLDEMEAEELAIKVAVHHALAEEQPSRYAEFVSQVLRQALLEEPDPERRRVLCNRIIDLLFVSGSAGLSGM